MPKLDGVLETALYVDDLERARGFYAEILGLSSLFADARMRAYAVGRDILLIFRSGASAEAVNMRVGTIPVKENAGSARLSHSISEEAGP